MPFSTLRHPLLIMLVYSLVLILTFIISGNTGAQKKYIMHALNTICKHGLDFKELPVIELLFQISEVVNWFHLLCCMEVFNILVAILLFLETFSAAAGFYVSCLLISWWAWSMRRRPEATPILGRFIRTSSQKSQFSHSRHLIGR